MTSRDKNRLAVLARRNTTSLGALAVATALETGCGVGHFEAACTQTSCQTTTPPVTSNACQVDIATYSNANNGQIGTAAAAILSKDCPLPGSSGDFQTVNAPTTLWYTGPSGGVPNTQAVCYAQVTGPVLAADATNTSNFFKGEANQYIQGNQQNNASDYVCIVPTAALQSDVTKNQYQINQDENYSFNDNHGYTDATYNGIVGTAQKPSSQILQDSWTLANAIGLPTTGSTIEWPQQTADQLAWIDASKAAWQQSGNNFADAMNKLSYVSTAVPSNSQPYATNMTFIPLEQMFNFSNLANGVYVSFDSSTAAKNAQGSPVAATGNVYVNYMNNGVATVTTLKFGYNAAPTAVCIDQYVGGVDVPLKSSDPLWAVANATAKSAGLSSFCNGGQTNQVAALDTKPQIFGKPNEMEVARVSVPTKVQAMHQTAQAPAIASLMPAAMVSVVMMKRALKAIPRLTA